MKLLHQSLMRCWYPEEFQNQIRMKAFASLANGAAMLEKRTGAARN